MSFQDGFCPSLKFTFNDVQSTVGPPPVSYNFVFLIQSFGCLQILSNLQLVDVSNLHIPLSRIFNMLISVLKCHGNTTKVSIYLTM